MSVFWKMPRMMRIFIMIFTLIVCTSISLEKANPQNVNSGKKTIALDPGHGGYDKGAQGVNGTLEKSVTLALSKMIMMELKNNYTVILTRSDDYWVDAYNRAGIANHSEADIFISIHMGGSFLHQTNKTSICYYREFSDQSADSGNFQNRPPIDRDVQTDWTDISKRHETTSRLLAERIQQTLDSEATFTNIEVKGAPLMVLEGADMPAILIELGHITNPAVEKSFKDNRILSTTARKIKRGVDAFFESEPHSLYSE